MDLGYAAKTRPGMIISIPALDTDRALVTLVAHTTSTRGSLFEVVIPKPFLKQGAFLAQNLVTIPHAKLMNKLGRLTADELATVVDAVQVWLGFKRDDIPDEQRIRDHTGFPDWRLHRGDFRGVPEGPRRAGLAS